MQHISRLKTQAGYPAESGKNWLGDNCEISRGTLICLDLVGTRPWRQRILKCLMNNGVLVID